MSSKIDISHDHDEFIEGCFRCDLTHQEAITAYEAELAELDDAEHLSGRHLNTVIRWHETEQVDGEYQVVPYVATITAIKHYMGFGLFGPSPTVTLSVCYDCVHRMPASSECEDHDLILYPGQSITVERNTTGETR